jgi:hypothetical protein
MPLFNLGKKKEEQPMGPPPGPQGPPAGMPPPGPPTGLPIEEVNNLRQQGLTDNQIIQTLQRDGFNSQQIFDAMNQAGIPQAGPLPPEQYGGEPQAPPPDMQGPPMGMPPPPQQMPGPPAPMEVGGAMGVGERERIEEMAEAIIDEKWEELIKNINKIFEWKEKTDDRVAKIEQAVEDMKKNYENLHKAIIGKISEYDENIMNVGTEIKAMEKVFQKILPTFTENVSELSRITKTVKKSGSKK